MKLYCKTSIADFFPELKWLNYDFENVCTGRLRDSMK